MSRLTRDGTAEPVSRDQILRHARGQGNIIFPVQLTTSRIGNITRLIHTLLYVMTIHTYIHTYKPLKRFMKAQLLKQCMIPRALFGGVENASKSVYSPGLELLLSRPSVGGAYFTSTQGKQLLGYQLKEQSLYCFQYVAAVAGFVLSVSLYVWHNGGLGNDGGKG